MIPCFAMAWPHIPWSVLQDPLLAWMILAVIAGTALLIYTYFHGGGRWLRLGPQRHYEVPWSLLDVIIILLLYQILAFGVIGLTKKLGTRWSEPFATPSPDESVLMVAEKVTTQAAHYVQPIPGLAVLGSELNWTGVLVQHRHQRAIYLRYQIMGNALANLVLVGFAVLYLKWRADAMMYQLGLHARRGLAQCQLAYLHWLWVTPVVFLLLILAHAFESVIGKQTPHVADQLFFFSPGWMSWTLLFFTAVVAAPLWEELLLRGILQPVLIKDPLWADSLIVLGMVIAVAIAFQEGSTLGPILFLVSVGPGYLLFDRLTRRWLPHPGAARGIFATSLFFASMHASAWPTPIPLFFLSLVLGYAGYRTQSLLAPIALHALFNLVSLTQALPMN